MGRPFSAFLKENYLIYFFRRCDAGKKPAKPKVNYKQSFNFSAIKLIKT